MDIGYFKFMLLIVTLMAPLHHLKAEESTISPNCLPISTTCITLSDFEPSSSNNLTLTLVTGVHSLDSLRISNRNVFSLTGEGQLTTINCTLGRNLIIRRVSSVFISRITFIGCNLRIESSNDTNISHSNFFSSSNGVLEFVNGANVKIDSSVFGNNQPSSRGQEVIEFVRTTGIEVTRCIFYNNNASSSGSVVAVSSASTGFIACSNFTDNIVDSFNSVVQIGSGSLLYIANSSFIGNRGTSSFSAIIWLSSNIDTVTIISSIFRYNTAVNSFGGIVYINNGGTVTILASEFSHNRNGGSINSRRGRGSVTVDCTRFLNNSASSDAAINVGPECLTLRNSSTCAEQFSIGERALCTDIDCEGTYTV